MKYAAAALTLTLSLSAACAPRTAMAATTPTCQYGGGGVTQAHNGDIVSIAAVDNVCLYSLIQAGTTGQVLTANGANLAPSYATAAGGGVTSVTNTDGFVSSSPTTGAVIVGLHKDSSMFCGGGNVGGFSLDLDSTHSAALTMDSHGVGSGFCGALWVEGLFLTQGVKAFVTAQAVFPFSPNSGETCTLPASGQTCNFSFTQASLTQCTANRIGTSLVEGVVGEVDTSKSGTTFTVTYTAATALPIGGEVLTFAVTCH